MNLPKVRKTIGLLLYFLPDLMAVTDIWYCVFGNKLFNVTELEFAATTATTL